MGAEAWQRGLIITVAIATAGATADDTAPQGAASPTSVSRCSDEPRLHALDFWIGRWQVSWRGEHVGSNIIEFVQGGCAVTENWTDIEGHTGFSLFYFDRTLQRWKQVWVTENALRVAGQKEKTELPDFTTATQIRFQGSYPDKERQHTILDRTTLTLNADKTVRQHIEISKDNGASWKTAFDGTYRRENR